jgi:hypothetical protein
MALSAEEQQDYDNHVEHFRDAARRVLRIGDDDLDSTKDDLRTILDGVFEEFE